MSAEPQDRGAAIHFISSTVLLEQEGEHYAMNSLHLPLKEALETHFDRILLALRVRAHEGALPSRAWRVEPPAEIHPLVPYKGPWQFLRRSPKVLARLIGEARSARAAMIATSELGLFFGTLMWFAGRPFGIQVVSDPDQIYRKGTVGGGQHLFRRPIVAWMRWLVRRAVAVAYVTEEQLQRAFPAREGVPTFAISNVELHHHEIASGPKAFPESGKMQLLFVGSMAQPYKGLDLLIDALAESSMRDRFALSVFGDGAYRAQYEAQAKDRGVDVDFKGLAPREQLLGALGQADLFLMPSRTEGLPRALIEAMARGLPAIGSDAGGIPELLDPAAIFPNGDLAALGGLLEKFATDQAFYVAQSARNLARAGDFEKSKLDARRDAFIAHLRAAHDLVAARNSGEAK